MKVLTITIAARDNESLIDRLKKEVEGFERYGIHLTSNGHDCWYTNVDTGRYQSEYEWEDYKKNRV